MSVLHPDWLPRMLTTEQAAAELQVTREVIWQWTARGHLPAYRLPDVRETYYRSDELIEAERQVRRRRAC